MSALTDAIKNSVDIVDIASRYTNLKKSGSNYVGLSPFKKERTGSFVISPQKQIFKCFSTGIGGNVITLIMEVEKVDFMDAIKILGGIGGVDLDNYLDNSDYDKGYNIKKQTIKRINKVLHDYARKQLEGSSALDYCVEKRKLGSEIIERFGLGYLPDSFDNVVGFLHTQGFSDDDIIQASLAKRSERGIFSFFRHRLLFPIWDHMDNVIGFGARALDEGQEPKYLNTSDTLLYDKSRVLYGINFVKSNIRDFQKIIVVEGYMDVIALHSAGFPIAVATCGTSLTIHHLTLIQRYSSDVYFLFDNDEAGLQATIRGLKLAYSRDLFPKMIRLDSLELGQTVKDIDDVVRLCGQGAKDTISQLIDNASDGFERVFEQLVKKSDNSPLEQKKLLVTLFDLIQQIQLPNTQSYYLSLLANKLSINNDYIKAQYLQYAKQGKYHSSPLGEEADPVQYRPKKSLLLAALFYNNFYTEHFEGNEYFVLLKNLLDTVLSSSDQDLLISVFSDIQLSDEDVTLIEEEQLRRAHEFQKYSTDQDRWIFVRSVLVDEINRIVQIVLKTSNLATQAKQDIVAKLHILLRK